MADTPEMGEQIRRGVICPQCHKQILKAVEQPDESFRVTCPGLDCNCDVSLSSALIRQTKVVIADHFQHQTN